jgi:hypothetical protein
MCAQVPTKSTSAIVVVSVFIGPGSYNSSSCGAVASTPLRIVGLAGSLSTTVNCSTSPGAGKRLLHTASTLAMSGITISGCQFRAQLSPHAAGYFTGGAAVFVDWDNDADDLGATFTDVRFVGNSVVLSGVLDAGTTFANGGGVAVFVNGGRSRVSVALVDCLIQSNELVAALSEDAGGLTYGSQVSFFGIGVCISIGESISDTATDDVITINGCEFIDNHVSPQAMPQLDVPTIAGGGMYAVIGDASAGVYPVIGATISVTNSSFVGHQLWNSSNSEVRAHTRWRIVLVPCRHCTRGNACHS